MQETPLWESWDDSNKLAAGCERRGEEKAHVAKVRMEPPQKTMDLGIAVLVSVSEASHP